MSLRGVALFVAQLRQAVGGGVDAPTLRSTIAMEPGYKTLRHAAEMLVLGGMTDEAEVLRVLGDGESES